MKNLLIFLATILSLNLLSQEDSLKKDTILYQYRIKINEISTNGSAKFVQEPLVELFKTIPIYYECISTFIFESKENIDKQVLIQNLPSAYNIVTDFNQEKIIPQRLY